MLPFETIAEPAIIPPVMIDNPSIVAHYRADVPHTIRNASRHPVETFLIVRYRQTTP